jgi:hypothetical protein
VDAVAVDLDEFSDSRHQPFGLCGNQLGRQHKAENDNGYRNEHPAQQPRQN